MVEHPGAVGVVALDAEDRVLLVNQYRHPVRRRLDELPAGLLDVAGEPALAAAQRELAEEAGLAADRWFTLVDVLTSPGMTDEAIRIFLALDVSPVERDVQDHEELEMTSGWVPLDEAVADALAGGLENAMAVLGVLAADQALRDGVGDAPARRRAAGAPARAETAPRRRTGRGRGPRLRARSALHRDPAAARPVPGAPPPASLPTRRRDTP